MPNYTLESFFSDCEDQAGTHGEPADIVRAVMPLMHRLLCGSRDFLSPEHFRSEPDHYARNLVYASDGAVSRAISTLKSGTCARLPW